MALPACLPKLTAAASPARRPQPHDEAHHRQRARNAAAPRANSLPRAGAACSAGRNTRSTAGRRTLPASPRKPISFLPPEGMNPTPPPLGSPSPRRPASTGAWRSAPTLRIHGSVGRRTITTTRSLHLSLPRSRDGSTGTDTIQHGKQDGNEHIRPLVGTGVARTMPPFQVPRLSETARAVLCKICKKPEEEGKSFLTCDHVYCEYKFYHAGCLNPGQIASEAQEGSQFWYCPSCICRRCFCDMEDDKIIICNECDEGYHLFCLEPALPSVPRGNWYCEFCAEEQMKKVRRSARINKKLKGARVETDKFEGVNVLLSAAEEMLRAEEEAEEAAAAAKKLEADEEAATAAEKLNADEEAAMAAE